MKVLKILDLKKNKVKKKRQRRLLPYSIPNNGKVIWWSNYTRKKN